VCFSCQSCSLVRIYLYCRYGFLPYSRLLLPSCPIDQDNQGRWKIRREPTRNAGREGGRGGRDRRAGLRSTTFWQPIIGRFPTILLVVVLGLNQDHKPLLIAAQIQRMRCQCHGCQHCWRIGSVVCGFPSPSIIPKFVCSHRRLTTSL